MNACATVGERSGDEMSGTQSDAVMIEVAINGSTKPSRNPHVPLEADAITADAFRCLDSGASIIHAHNHDIGLQGQDPVVPESTAS